MARTRTRIRVGAGEVQRELKRLKRARPNSELNKVMDLVASNAASRVHKDTHSLLLSEHVTYIMSKDKWERQVAFGGSSAGVHNPVNYALAEWARGENHNFFGDSTEGKNKVSPVVREALAQAIVEGMMKDRT